MSGELEPLTRLLMVAESLTGETCPECGIGEDDAQVLRDVHAELQARVEELEATLRSSRDKVDRMIGGSDRNYARIEELEEANAAVEEENDLLRDVIQQKHARVEVLTAALRPFVESRIPSSDPDAWFAMFRNARAALAAGTTESAPLPLNESGEVPLSYFSKPGETESEASDGLS